MCNSKDIPKQIFEAFNSHLVENFVCVSSGISHGFINHPEFLDGLTLRERPTRAENFAKKPGGRTVVNFVGNLMKPFGIRSKRKKKSLKSFPK